MQRALPFKIREHRICSFLASQKSKAFKTTDIVNLLESYLFRSSIRCNWQYFYPSKNRNQRPEDRETRGPGAQRTTGPGPWDQRTRNQRTRGPEDQRTRAPGDQGTRGPGDQRTRGPGDQRTRIVGNPPRVSQTKAEPNLGEKKNMAPSICLALNTKPKHLRQLNT